jgi:hypothetical protein
MADIAERFARQLAAHSSRRGFLSLAGKVALGAGAVAAGVGLGTAHAAPCYCCGLDGSSTCWNEFATCSCPPNTVAQDWYCCSQVINGQRYYYTYQACDDKITLSFVCWACYTGCNASPAP